MRRRHLLAAAGLAVGTAGCLGNEPTADTGTALTTTTSTGTTKTTGTDATTAGTVDVTGTTLQQALAVLQTDYLSVFGGDERYLLATAAVSGRRLDADAFELRIDGDAYSPDSDGRAGRLWRAYQSGNAYEPDAGGLLLFELPVDGFASTDDAALTWPGGEHPLRDGLRERLRADAPPLSVDVDGPETVRDGDSPTFDVAVTNDGTIPARLVAGLNRFGPRVASVPVTRFSTLVDTGGTTTATYTDDRVTGGRIDDAAIGDGESDVRYGWNGANRDAEFSIRYVADDT
ncbi:hypothetical protein [Halorubellus sp. PRR65]|uniref:hypothetical protein n=1 Tax=Halorubellus sp. PRR65 TaxID=3098148 RepID=UPI002B257EDD|nr:hypothetical protein [Halorubellus sp. PRR65]